MSKTIAVVGGTGAQGSVVVRALISSGHYAVKALTRDTTSQHAQELAALPNVTLIEGSSYDEPTLDAAFKGAYGAFINTNGFALGEKSELYWGIRMYELAARAGVKHFVYSGLDYLGRLTNFDDKYHVGHYEGKSKVGEYLKAQPLEPMAWTFIASGPYIEQLFENQAPRQDADGTYVFRSPLYKDGTGALPYIYLCDLALYALWALDTPAKSSGLWFGIATEHVGPQKLVDAFSSVTGKPARFEEVSVEEWALKRLGTPEMKIGLKHSNGYEDETFMTGLQNFTAWWQIYRDGIIKRDYAFLDEILPGRVKSLEEWMRKVGYVGQKKVVLKDMHDRGLVVG